MRYIPVTRQQVLAASLKMELDRQAGRSSHPRVVALANAATVREEPPIAPPAQGLRPDERATSLRPRRGGDAAVRAVKPARVIPWDAMTDQQQADHLRLMHGMGGETWSPDYWHRVDHSVPLDSWPPSARHTHDKEPR